MRAALHVSAADSAHIHDVIARNIHTHSHQTALNISIRFVFAYLSLRGPRNFVQNTLRDHKPAMSNTADDGGRGSVESDWTPAALCGPTLIEGLICSIHSLMATVPITVFLAWRRRMQPAFEQCVLLSCFVAMTTSLSAAHTGRHVACM